MRYKKIAAIICAYNEQKTIESILKDISVVPLINEIIVINDGSQDSTGQKIKSLKAEIDFTDVHLSKNMGKGYAMAKGVEISDAGILLFVDADITNFTNSHALKLLDPVITGKADMVLGQPTETLIRYRMNPFKKLSGQRALRKADILPVIDKMKTSGYGVETLINMHYKATGKTSKLVSLEKLIHPAKFEKTNPAKAIKDFLSEGSQILNTIFINHKIFSKPVNKFKTLRIVSSKITAQ